MSAGVTPPRVIPASSRPSRRLVTAFDRCLAIVVTGALGLALVALGLVATGHTLLAIRSGSMVPALPVGALAIVAPFAEGEPNPGDIVTYPLQSGQLVSHRVLREFEIDGEPYVVTRGDANDHEDPVAVPERVLTGRVDTVLAGIGQLLWAFQSTAGRIAAILACLTLVVIRWYIEPRPAWRRVVVTNPVEPKATTGRREPI